MRDDLELTDKTAADRLLEAERLSLDQMTQRLQRRFPDVLADRELSQVALDAIITSREAGLNRAEAVDIAGRVARQFGQTRPAPDDTAARSRAIAEIAAGRSGGAR
jgi:hypothetical protein